MKINKTVIEPLKPCSDRFNNFLAQYPEFDGELHEFLNLENITYNDKIWVTTRLMTKIQLVRWSIMCAESVKVHFNNKYPNNKCLDDLFSYLNSIEDFESLTVGQKEEILKLRRAAYAAADADAAYTAAQAAAYAAAYAAAQAAAYAAADAAYAAYAAAQAAAYAAYAAVQAAAYAAADAAYAGEEQRNLNLLYLSTVIE